MKQAEDKLSASKSVILKFVRKKCQKAKNIRKIINKQLNLFFFFYRCTLDANGKPLPDDYNYYPTIKGLKDHLETRVEAPVETFYNALTGN